MFTNLAILGASHCMILPKHGSTVYSDFPVMKHIVSWIDLVENLQETSIYIYCSVKGHAFL